MPFLTLAAAGIKIQKGRTRREIATIARGFAVEAKEDFDSIATNTGWIKNRWYQ
jgi:hypothetical protein